MWYKHTCDPSAVTGALGGEICLVLCRARHHRGTHVQTPSWLVTAPQPLRVAL